MSHIEGVAMSVILSVAIIVLAGFFSLLPADINGQRQFTRPTLIAVLCKQVPKWHVKFYEDKDYLFSYRHYGKGEYVPGVFVYNKKLSKWLEIKKLSTENAKLGQSPPFDEVKL